MFSVLQRNSKIKILEKHVKQHDEQIHYKLEDLYLVFNINLSSIKYSTYDVNQGIDDVHDNYINDLNDLYYYYHYNFITFN